MGRPKVVEQDTIGMVALPVDEVKWLQSQGFVKRWLDDNSGWWLEKKLKHPVLSRPTLNVDRHYGTGKPMLFLDAQGVDGDNFMHLWEKEYSRLTLAEVIKGLGLC